MSPLAAVLVAMAVVVLLMVLFLVALEYLDELR